MNEQLEIFLPSERYGHETGILVDFMNELVVNSQVSVRTAYNYYMVVRSLAKYLTKRRHHLDAPVDEVELRNVSLEFMTSLTKEEWDEYLDFYLEKRAEKCSSRAFRITVFRRFYSWIAQKTGAPPLSYVVETSRPTPTFRTPDPVSAGTMHEIVRSMKGEMRMRDICIVTMAYECGLGLDELSALQMEDLELERIRVRSSSGRVRYVPLTPDAQKAVNLYLPFRIPPLEDDNPLFVSRKRGRLKRTALHNILSKAVARSPSLSRHVSFRSLQQTWAIRMSQTNEDEMPERSRVSSQWYLCKKIEAAKDIHVPSKK